MFDKTPEIVTQVNFAQEDMKDGEETHLSWKRIGIRGICG